MSLMGISMGSIGAQHYCHMCASHSCHHILGAQQNMSNEIYNQYLRQQMGIAQQQGIAISSGSLTAGNITSTEKCITVGDQPKPNRKLLLLME